MTQDVRNGNINPHDFLSIDSLLSDQEKLIRSTVREWVQNEVNPYIADWFENGGLPKELGKAMGNLGMLGMHLEGYGCAGTSAVEYGLAAIELEAGDSGVRSFMSVQGSLAMFPIWKFGSEEQKQQWLPGMASGDILGCFGLTESESGSDAANMLTTARQDGSDWIINGAKMWITNGNIADVAIVWARADDNSIRGFIVPTDTPGFSAHPIKKKMSLRASNTAELAFDEMRLPADALLPGVASMRGPFSCLNEARFGIAFGVMGAARDCYETALSYAGERQAFGGPISRFQLTQQKLVDMMVKVNKGTLLALHLGRMRDLGTLETTQISFGKMDNCAVALEVAREARSILGGNGITLEYPVIRHMVNLETTYTYEGTNEIHKLIIGNAITGQPAFS